MTEFQLVSDFKATGDQPAAIDMLIEGVNRGDKYQTLLGATGTGKTFTIANIIQQTQRPTLILAHNKTLAAQLYSEFREFFPKNSVSYFVSYYDYYQPEAYVPRHDLYIEKETQINDEIDRLRLQAMTSLKSRRDVIIVASVSCIYGIGNPEAWGNVILQIERGGQYRRRPSAWGSSPPGRRRRAGAGCARPQRRSRCRPGRGRRRSRSPGSGR